MSHLRIVPCPPEHHADARRALVAEVLRGTLKVRELLRCALGLDDEDVAGNFFFAFCLLVTLAKQIAEGRR